MRKTFKNLLFIGCVIILQTGIIFAQSGKLRGTIIDNSTGETIPFATVFVKESTSGTTSDLDGSYYLDLSPGIYTVEYSFIGYSSLTVQSVEIKEGDVTLLDVNLSEESQLLEEIVVSAKQIRNTETAILAIQKKSPNLLDGISSQSFRRIGDSDAASAIKRVTGVSVEGGKYVFVRGLGDRYTKSILNGMEVPGLDPDRNTLQMDIFPTNLIDNIIVLKSFTPDLPGDFTGGVVDIVTKDFPERKSIKFSGGVSYNPDMHLQDAFVSYPGSSTDWLGFDDGLRDLPIHEKLVIPSIASNIPVITEITEKFNSTLASQRTQNFVDYNFSVSAGNQLNKEKMTLGYNAAINYKRSYDFYDDVEYNSFIKNPDYQVFDLETDRTQRGQLGKDNVLLSGLIGGAMKFSNHKIALQLMHIQNGESTAGDFEQNSFIFSSNTIFRDNLEYTQRSISNALLSGRHSFDAGGFELEWKLAPTISKIYDKDIRVTPFRFDDGNYSIEPSEGAIPIRLYRNLDEVDYTGKIDLTKKLWIAGKESKLKLGFSQVMKDRDYEILSYRFNVKGQSILNLNGDPDELLQPENIWTGEQGYGTYVEGNFEPANTYSAQQNIMGLYVMNELPLGDKLKAIYGFRVERFEHIYTGQNNLGTIVFDKEKLIDNWNILPSVNLVYSLTDDINLRASFSKTLARPSFKESSIAQIYDAVSDRTFIGNTDLVETNINNFDLRWEMYQNGGQMWALSGFYKTFKDPIEIVPFSRATPTNFQPKNVGDATVAGMEIEMRRNLKFVSEFLEPISVGANLTVVYSSVEMDKSLNGEYDSRLQTAREGESVADTRRMQGQSPYIINSYISYTDIELGWEANLSYNVQGRRIAITGIGEIPDIYERPYHSLNAKVSRTFGSEGQFGISAGLINILGSERVKEYDSFMASEAIFERLNPHRSFSLSFSYAIR